MPFLEDIVRGFERLGEFLFGHRDPLTGLVLSGAREGGAHDEHSYHLDRLLHGSRSVYAAFDTASGELVAVKVFDDMERYQRETVCGRQLRHGGTNPHVLLAHEFPKDPCSQRGFAVYPYLRGERLADYAARVGALPAAEAATITAQVLDGLEFMHTYGVVHRDVKLGNVMLQICNPHLTFITGEFVYPKKGHVKAVVHDFDVSYHASLADLDTGRMFGTPSYMAPEIWQGDTGDPRSDVYAAGVMFYRLLTGRFPFRDDISASLAVQHLMTLPPTILLPDRNISYALTEIIHTSLAKNPDFRYQTAKEMEEKLDEVFGL